MDFLQRRQQSLLGPDLALTRIDFGFNEAVDGLCLRLACEPDLEIASQPREVRALLSLRLVTIVVWATKRPPAFPPFTALGPLDDTAARATLFEHVLSTMRLHPSRHGQLLSSERATMLH